MHLGDLQTCWQTMIGTGHPAEAYPQLKAQKIRALAIATPERDPSLKDVPTLKEEGIDVFNWGAVKGIAAAKGTPKEIIDYYDGVFKKICEDSEFKHVMTDMLQPVQYQGPEEFAKFLQQAYDDYGKIINDLGLAKK